MEMGKSKIECITETAVCGIPVDAVQVFREIPSHLRVARDSCFIDKEIAPVIDFLWSLEVKTLGCCSGHDIIAPSVVIDEGHSKDQILEIKRSIHDELGIWVEILQWESTLVKY